MTPEHWIEAALGEYLMDPDERHYDALHQIRAAFLAGARAMAEHLADNIGIKVDPDDEAVALLRNDADCVHDFGEKFCDALRLLLAEYEKTHARLRAALEKVDDDLASAEEWDKRRAQPVGHVTARLSQARMEIRTALKGPPDA